MSQSKQTVYYKNTGPKNSQFKFLAKKNSLDHSKENIDGNIALNKKKVNVVTPMLVSKKVMHLEQADYTKVFLFQILKSY
jgi:hypothetical protein